jgi:hypothetical protein
MPEPHGLVADLDTPIMQQILDISQRQQKPNVQNHSQTNIFGGRL